ncbi:MAG: desulfoferrodoxin [Sedimentisphaerales bacterium]|nr:desulfoferrodoxin [Sedimentisphaerales bacterium]
MAEMLQIYRCKACGNIVEVLHAGAGTLVCCGANMEKLEPKTADSATEKHVPVIEKSDSGIKVKVGSVPHPMTGEHYIEWISILADGKTCRKFLKPNDAPEAVFCVTGDSVTAQEFCNVHGLWKG